SGFTALNALMGMYSKLIFFSCLAGDGQNGSSLLRMISNVISPRKYVIGFNKEGAISPVVSMAGQIGATLGGEIQLSAKELGNLQRLDELSPFAKWALEGQIVWLARIEQRSQPGKRCGWPKCPGHANENDRCAPFKCSSPKCPGHLGQLDRCS